MSASKGPTPTEALGFARYAAGHMVVASARPGTLAVATERRRLEVMAATGATRAEYDRLERAVVERTIDLDPWAVLDAEDAGGHAGALLAGFASKVAHERLVPAATPVERFHRAARAVAAKRASKARAA